MNLCQCEPTTNVFDPTMLTSVFREKNPFYSSFHKMKYSFSIDIATGMVICSDNILKVGNIRHAQKKG